jgi:enoyl-[acyl-carrier protein] reductase I
MLPQNDFLKGKAGLVVGIANEHSIAAAFHASGAKLCLTYQTDKSRRFVEPVATSVDADF